MIIVNEDKSISVTRGDAVTFTVSADIDGEKRLFEPGDVVCIKVYEKKNTENVVLQKYFPVVYEQEYLPIYLSSKETKIGGLISKAVDYWYEIELNPFTDPQTIVGYDEDGPKVFKLFPEGRDLEDEPITEEDIPIVDAELDLTSTRPVQNQAIARELAQLNAKVDAKVDTIDDMWTDVNVALGDFSIIYEESSYKCRRLGAMVVLQAHITCLYDDTGGHGLFYDLPIPEQVMEWFIVDNGGRVHWLELNEHGILYLSRDDAGDCEIGFTITYFTNEP